MATQARSWSPDPRERTFDMRSLRRLGIWGGSATAALLVAMVASYSDTGTRRLASASAQKPDAPPPQVASRLPELDAQTKRLAGMVDALAADRERLIARIGTLERNLEDVTGAIKRQASTSQAATSQAGTSAATAPSAAPASSPPAAAPAPAPVKEAAKAPAKETILPPAPEPPATVLALPPAAPAAPQPPPPERIAPAVMAADGPAADPVMTEFGVDIGGAVNFDGLRGLWSSTRGNNPALLEGLHPVVAVRENSRTKGAELRLVVGPLANVETAARLCAALSAARRYCQPVGFEGQRLADADMVPERAPSERKPAAAPKPKASPAPIIPYGPRLFR